MTAAQRAMATAMIYPIAPRERRNKDTAKKAARGWRFFCGAPSPSPRRPRALSADRVRGARRQQVARRTSCRRLVFLLLAAHHDQVAPVLRRGPSSGGTSLHIGEPQLAVPVEWDPEFFVGSHPHITFFYGRA
jgi:hypothetical protein